MVKNINTTEVAYLQALRLAFAHLDTLLDQAISQAETLSSEQHQEQSRSDGNDGDDGDESDLPQFETEQTEDLGSPLQGFAEVFGLSGFDLNILLIALAPEFDLHYQKLYAYLQQDGAKLRPTIDLALNLLCPDGLTKMVRRDRFASDAPLMAQTLIHLIPAGSQYPPLQLAYGLQVDHQIVRLLLGQGGIDPRLTGLCHLTEPNTAWDDLTIDPPIIQQLRSRFLAQATDSTRGELRLYCYGTGDLCGQVAGAIAQERGAPLLRVNMAQLLAQKLDLSQMLPLICREAQVHQAILYLEQVHELGTDANALGVQQLLEALGQTRGLTKASDGTIRPASTPRITVLAGPKAWQVAATGELGAMVLPLPLPPPGPTPSLLAPGLAPGGADLGPGGSGGPGGSISLNPPTDSPECDGGTESAR
jgi:hypothetical protein